MSLNYMLYNEKDILERISEGEEPAFRELFSWYYPKVRVFLTEILKDREVAEDIAQDVFARVWLLRSTIPEIRSFGSYLYAMTRNSALLYLKKHRPSLTIEDFDFAVDQSVDSHLAAEEKAESYGLSKYKVRPTHPDDALKVMIVEDNAELKIYVYNSLINKYDVRDASNGVEALSIIGQGWMPDIIVTDLMMPQMDGIGLVNHIRNDFNTSHIPIIMITAKHEDDTHLKAMKYGVDGYISKPFTMELLAARIENLMERRRTLLSRFAENGNAGKKGAKIEIQPDEIVITDRDETLIKKVMGWLEENVSDAEVTVDQLAAHVGMGRTSMYNKIKGLTGKSPVELIQDYRLEKATYYLKSGQYSVSETCYKVGFSDPGYFSRTFKKHFGISPVDYIKEHKTDKQ